MPHCLDEGYSQTRDSHTGLARPFYFRIGATWCNTPTERRDVPGRKEKKTGMDKCLQRTSVLSSTCHSQETLLRRCCCSVAYKLDLRRAHALRRQQARCQPRPFGSADSAKIVYFRAENDPIVTNYTFSPNQCLLFLDRVKV